MATKFKSSRRKKTEQGKIETECGGEREKAEVSSVRSLVSELAHTQSVYSQAEERGGADKTPGNKVEPSILFTFIINT